MPKKIEIKLNSKKYVNKRIDDDRLFDVPTLQQLQNYVKYLKNKVCNNYNIKDVKKLTDNAYYDDIDPKEFFKYAADVGNGTDEDHMQICFTST